jgi:hypothetical protein
MLRTRTGHRQQYRASCFWTQSPYPDRTDDGRRSRECAALVDEPRHVERAAVIERDLRKENTMSSRLMIVFATVGIVGASVASGALAAPYHRGGDARYFSGVNVSDDVYGARYAAVGDVNPWGYGFGADGSGPRYHGGPKSSY